MKQLNRYYRCAKISERKTRQIIKCFALWTNEASDEKFTKHLESIFGAATAQTIEFQNPYTNSVSANSVYIAHNKGGSNNR